LGSSLGSEEVSRGRPTTVTGRAIVSSGGESAHAKAQRTQRGSQTMTWQPVKRWLGCGDVSRETRGQRGSRKDAETAEPSPQQSHTARAHCAGTGACFCSATMPRPALVLHSKHGARHFGKCWAPGFARALPSQSCGTRPRRRHDEHLPSQRFIPVDSRLRPSATPPTDPGNSAPSILST